MAVEPVYLPSNVPYVLKVWGCTFGCIIRNPSSLYEVPCEAIELSLCSSDWKSIIVAEAHIGTDKANATAHFKAMLVVVLYIVIPFISILFPNVTMVLSIIKSRITWQQFLPTKYRCYSDLFTVRQRSLGDPRRACPRCFTFLGKGLTIADHALWSTTPWITKLANLSLTES